MTAGNGADREMDRARRRGKSGTRLGHRGSRYPVRTEHPTAGCVTDASVGFERGQEPKVSASCAPRTVAVR